MPSTDDLLTLLRAQEGTDWQPETPASEEEVADTVTRLGFQFVPDYRTFLLYSNGGRLEGDVAWITFDPLEDLLEFNGGAYYHELRGMFIFGGDEGDFIYYLDRENRFGKGPWAAFMVGKGCADRQWSRYLAPDLRHFVQRILAGDSFTDEPYLG